MDGSTLALPWQRHKLTKAAWRRVAIQLMNQVVHVQPNHAPLPLAKDTLQKMGLGNCLYLGNPAHDEALLRLVLVSDTGDFCGYQGALVHEKMQIQYRYDLGYRIIK